MGIRNTLLKSVEKDSDRVYKLLEKNFHLLEDYMITLQQNQIELAEKVDKWMKENEKKL